MHEHNGRQTQEHLGIAPGKSVDASRADGSSASEKPRKLNSIILEILDAAHQLVDKGKGPRFVCFLASNRWDKLHKELELIPMVQCSSSHVRPEEVHLNGSGLGPCDARHIGTTQQLLAFD